MAKQTILEIVMERLAAATATDSLAQIARGAGVERRWLSAVVRGKIRNPGIDGVQKLADYFRGRK